MEELIHKLIVDLHTGFLFVIIAITLYTLGKGADWLVDEAVILSTRWGVPQTLIGATVVSLGTTTPEAAVSVLAAVTGKPGMALGNAVGSIICDTGLILGLAALIAPLPLNRKIVNRQGWLQLGAGVLLVVACLPVSAAGRHLPQFMGFVFLILLASYMWLSIRWARDADAPAAPEGAEPDDDEATNTLSVLVKLIFAIVVVVVSSVILIPTVKETAIRLKVPESIIAATLVAFGTSLPELVTAVTATIKGQGELAVGNVIGADILNVLFVAGASAAVTGGGLVAELHFFRILFPLMLFILVVFRVGIFFSGDRLKRPFGGILIGAYVVYLAILIYTRVGMH